MKSETPIEPIHSCGPRGECLLTEEDQGDGVFDNLDKSLDLKGVSISLTKVSRAGQVQILHEMIEKLGLKDGLKLMVFAVEDMVILSKPGAAFARHDRGIVGRIRSIFSRIPIKNIEE